MEGVRDGAEAGLVGLRGADGKAGGAGGGLHLWWNGGTELGVSWAGLAERGEGAGPELKGREWRQYLGDAGRPG